MRRVVVGGIAGPQVHAWSLGLGLLAMVSCLLLASGSVRGQECTSGMWVESELGVLVRGVSEGGSVYGQIAVSEAGDGYVQAVKTRRTPSSFKVTATGKHGGEWVFERVMEGTVTFGGGGVWSLVAGAGMTMVAVVGGKLGEPLEAVGEAGVVTSDDGGHWACTAAVPGGQAMVVDGEPGEAFEAVTSPVWSQAGVGPAYVALLGGRQRVLNGRRVVGEHAEVLSVPAYLSGAGQLVYGASEGGKESVWVDGAKVLEGEGLAASCPVLGAGGWLCGVRQEGVWWVYVARCEAGGLCSVERVGGSSEGFVDGSAVSVDGKKWVYGVRRGGRVEVEYGGKVVGSGEELLMRPVLSADGGRVALVLERAGRWSVVEDGALVGEFDSVSGLSFGGLESRLWFVAMAGGKVGLWSGGKAPVEWVDAMSAPVHSTTGEVAWVEVLGGETRIMRDGKGSVVGMEDIADGTLGFSGDGTLVLFGRSGGGAVAWADGCMSEPLEGVSILGGRVIGQSPSGQPFIVGRRGDKIKKLTFVRK